jgi:hypothetical protein
MTILKKKLSQNISNITDGFTIEKVLSCYNSFGIFTLTIAALNPETSDPTTCYDVRLAHEFKSRNKTTEFMESIFEVEKNFEGLYLEDVEQILENSEKEPYKFLELICKTISQNNHHLKSMEDLYKEGKAIVLRRYMPTDSQFLDERTNLWFERYFASETQPFISESIFCMGVGHIHPLTNDHYVIIRQGFLQKIEGKGWKIENLNLNGSWSPWSTESYLKKLLWQGALNAAS